jgi:hypothetical protein
MWELTEGFFHFLRSRKIRLPLFVSLAIIGTVILLSYQGSIQKEPLVIPTVEVSPLPTLVEIPSKTKVHTPSQPKKIIEADNEQNNRIEGPQSPEPARSGNVFHFQDSLTDSLKVEGLDREISQQIFKHMRSQLNQDENVHYEIADSVRAVLPEASDEEVYRIAELVSNTATESFESSQR